jgi:hypothetical protein
VETDRSLLVKSAGGAENCPLRGVFFYVEKHLGLVLLSVIRSSGVSVLEGL